ncbi:MAG: hypothetical protein ABWY13_04755 [Mesorhizobium sp.]
MRPFLINSALAIAIGMTGLPLLASGASAQDIEFSIGRNGPSIRTIDRCDPDLEYCYERQDFVDRPVARGCSEGRALNKAQRMGINRARIVSAGRRTIEVRGRTPDGDRAYVTFSRRPGCPVLEY